jgi:chromosome segregation ATPase
MIKEILEEIDAVLATKSSHSRSSQLLQRLRSLINEGGKRFDAEVDELLEEIRTANHRIAELTGDLVLEREKVGSRDSEIAKLQADLADVKGVAASLQQTVNELVAAKKAEQDAKVPFAAQPKA